MMEADTKCSGAHVLKKRGEANSFLPASFMRKHVPVDNGVKEKIDT